MHSGAYLLPCGERDQLALRDCSIPPGENLTPEQARCIRTLHAGHPPTCLQRHARAATAPNGVAVAENSSPATIFTGTPSQPVVDDPAAGPPSTARPVTQSAGAA